MKQPQFNDHEPIEKGSLSPPIVGSPIYECARAVYVSGFIPHATISVHANGVEVIAVDKPYFGYATLHLSRALNVGDVITATQSAFGLTSHPSIDPVVVGHQPSSLGAPQVGDTLYDCGQVVPVGQLTVSAHVDVFQSTNPAGSQAPADRVGQADTATNWTPVVTSRLHAGEYVTAVETSCPGTAHQIISPRSPAVQVRAEPTPMTAPTLDPPVVGNDAVAGASCSSAPTSKPGTTPPAVRSAVGWPMPTPIGFP